MRICNNLVRITYDPAKRERTLRARGLDFEDARTVFAGPSVEFEDRRRDYRERRVLCVGFLGARMVMLGYVPRGADRHIFSMRKCNDREIGKYQEQLENR
jgi:hypothetical protein